MKDLEFRMGVLGCRNCKAWVQSSRQHDSCTAVFSKSEVCAIESPSSPAGASDPWFRVKHAWGVWTVCPTVPTSLGTPTYEHGRVGIHTYACRRCARIHTYTHAQSVSTQPPGNCSYDGGMSESFAYHDISIQTNRQTGSKKPC